MRVLDIDAGNTRMKWRYLAGGRVVATGALVNCASSKLLEQLQYEAPGAVDQCRLTSVRSPKELEALCCGIKSVLGVRPRLPDPESGVGDLVFFDADPRGLGDDRWLAMLGARKLYPNQGVIVVDSGTAMTLDVVDANGVFQGGLITPGLNTMLKAMAASADLLVLPEEKSFNRALAKNSVQAVLNGALSMAISLIEREVQRVGDGVKVVLCGGDSLVLAGQLSIPVEHHPGLVFDGLEIALPVKGM